MRLPKATLPLAEPARLLSAKAPALLLSKSARPGCLSETGTLRLAKTPGPLCCAKPATGLRRAKPAALGGAEAALCLSGTATLTLGLAKSARCRASPCRRCRAKARGAGIGLIIGKAWFRVVFGGFCFALGGFFGLGRCFAGVAHSLRSLSLSYCKNYIFIINYLAWQGAQCFIHYRNSMQEPAYGVLHFKPFLSLVGDGHCNLRLP